MNADPTVLAQQEQADAQQQSGWQELWRKEDWWAVWLGLSVVVLAYVLFSNGSSIRPPVRSPRPPAAPHRAALRAAGRGVPGAADGGRVLHRPAAQAVHSLLPAGLPAFDPHFRRRQLGPGATLQPGAAAGGPPARLDHFQPDRSAALAGRGFPRRVLRQARHHFARGDLALHADRLGGSGRHPPGVGRFHHPAPPPRAPPPAPAGSSSAAPGSWVWKTASRRCSARAGPSAAFRRRLPWPEQSGPGRSIRPSPSASWCSGPSS